MPIGANTKVLVPIGIVYNVDKYSYFCITSQLC